MDGVDEDGNGFVHNLHGWDLFDEDADPLDENGHGTLVATQIAGADGNGVGIAGVAPTAQVMPLGIFNDFGFTTVAGSSNLIRATTYAARNGSRVVNLSLGGPTFSRAERDQMVWLDRQDVLVVTAAGNGGADLIGDDNDLFPTYPASYDVPNILAVAALDRSGGLTSFSNFGSVSVDPRRAGSGHRGGGGLAERRLPGALSRAPPSGRRSSRVTPACPGRRSTTGSGTPGRRTARMRSGRSSTSPSRTRAS